MNITEENLSFFKNLLLEFSYNFNKNPNSNQSKNSHYKNYSKIILTNEFSKNIYSNKKKIPDILTASLYSKEKHLSDNQFQYIMRNMCVNFNKKIEQKVDSDCCWLVQLDGILQTLPEKPVGNNSVRNNSVRNNSVGKKPIFVLQENEQLPNEQLPNAQLPNAQLPNAQLPNYSRKIKLVIPFSNKEKSEIVFFEMTSLTGVDDVSIEMYPGIFIEKPNDIPNVNSISCEVLLQLHKSSQNNSWIGFSEYKKSMEGSNKNNARLRKEYTKVLNKKKIVSNDDTMAIENSYQKRCHKYYRNEYSNEKHRMPGSYNHNQINQKTEVLTDPNKLVNGIRIKTTIKPTDYIPLSAYLHRFGDEIETTQFSHKNPIIAFTSFNFILSAQEFSKNKTSSKNIPLSHFKNITLLNNTKEYVLLFQVQSVDDYTQHDSFQVPVEFLASDGYIIIVVQKPNSKNLIRLYEHETENKKKVLYASTSQSQIERIFYRHRVKLLKSIETYMTVIVDGLTNVCKITALVFEEVEEIEEIEEVE